MPTKATKSKSGAASKRTTSAKSKAQTDDALNKDGVAAEPYDAVGVGSVTATPMPSGQVTPETNPPSDTGTVHAKDPEEAEASQQSNEQYAEDGSNEDTTATEGTYAEDRRLAADSDPRLQAVDNHPTEPPPVPQTVATAGNDYLANHLAAGTEEGLYVPAPVWTGQNLIYNPDSPVPASPSADPPPMIYDPPASSLPPGRVLPRNDVVTNPPAWASQVGMGTAVETLVNSDDFVPPDEVRPTVAEVASKGIPPKGDS